ncbi:hypothetical protein AGR4A_pAt30190 [Agrobacterium tumefaciens str. B6]|uniref:Uncharacterized protein n=2 Tax=Agrobacterium tumefaciens complex TaxID=1183400 RepID=A0A822VE29_AGRTU|nr:hypothetical protein [Agrobacterium tumefaciens]CVI25375.1 hypothetical protein AGR4A_pAt30190 [Agrobacterium tumefaciens str. B6]
MDPTVMPKILLFFGKNGGGAGESDASFKPRTYTLERSDYVVVAFETPDSGGYYAERCRYFFRSLTPSWWIAGRR